MKKWIDKLHFGYGLFISTTLLTFVVFLITRLRSNVFDDMSFNSWIYFLFSALGHASIFALILFLIYMLLSIFIRRRYAAIIYVSMAVLLQLFLVLDSLVFNIYKFHINSFVVDLILGAGTDAFVFDIYLYIKFLGLIFLVAVLPYLIALKLSTSMYDRLTRKWIAVLSLLCIIGVVYSHLGYAYASATRNLSVQSSATALPYFFPLTMRTFLAKMGVEPDKDIDESSFNATLSNFNYPLNPIQTSDSIPKYNIVHIVVDSWNPRVFDSIVMPNTYAFAKKGSLYTNHLSSSNGTRGSIFGMFFGIPYAYDKEIEMTKLCPLFMDHLMLNNYNIQAFPSATLENPPFHKWIFRKVENLNIKTKGDTPFDRDKKLTELGLDFIKQQTDERPFYAFMFYDLLHAITIPKEYTTQFQPSWESPDYMQLSNDFDPTLFFNLYKNCAYYLDSLIGNVLKSLEEQGLLEDTIVIITGDHGQEFNENKKNYWGHSGNFSDWQIKVPFILYDPNKKGGQVYSHTTTHYDVSPTLLSRYLGVTNPIEDYSTGHDMDDTISSRFPHMIGQSHDFGFILENIIASTNHLGMLTITDRHLNDIPRNSLDPEQLKEAIKIKNRFYKD